jgi:hypothetical protein
MEQRNIVQRLRQLSSGRFCPTHCRIMDSVRPAKCSEVCKEQADVFLHFNVSTSENCVIVVSLAQGQWYGHVGRHSPRGNKLGILNEESN